MALKEPGQPGAGLVGHVTAGGHGKDVIQLFQSPLLGLWEPEEDHDQRDDVQCRVEAESTLGREGLQDSREGN